MFKDLRHKIEFGVGIAVILAMVLFGTLYYGDKSMQFLARMFVGGSIGYALARASFGFAGTVNRAYNSGSTKLYRAVAALFLMGGLVTFLFILGGFDTASLSRNSLNWGLLIGATLFGFGMSMTICCASGVLTDLAESPLRALLVLFFFCGGAYLGTALKNADWMAWYKEPIFGIEAIKGGVNFTDWFKWDGANGGLGALLLTAILVLVVICLAHLYEQRRKKKETFVRCAAEITYEDQQATHQPSDKWYNELFYNIFVKKWSLLQGAVVIAIAYGVLMLVFKSTWGVSGPLGQWFGRLLVMFGVPAESVASFAGVKPETYTSPFFQQQMYIQDLSIFVGALIAFLLSGDLTRNVKGWLFKPLEIIPYAIGGICLGIAINLAGGCNAGGLFSPISQFSLSGWIYLICITGGGILGNMARKAFYKGCKLD